MFRITKENIVAKEVPLPGTYSSRMVQVFPPPQDFQALDVDAIIATFLLLNLMVLGLAPIPHYSYKRKFKIFQDWDAVNHRSSLPANKDTVALHLPPMGIKKRKCTPVLAARASIRYYLITSYPDTVPPTESAWVYSVLKPVFPIRMEYGHPHRQKSNRFSLLS